MNIVITVYGGDFADHTNKVIVYERQLFPLGVEKDYVDAATSHWKHNFATKACAWYQIAVIEGDKITYIQDYHPIKQPVVLNAAAKKTPHGPKKMKAYA